MIKRDNSSNLVCVSRRFGVCIMYIYIYICCFAPIIGMKMPRYIIYTWRRIQNRICSDAKSMEFEKEIHFYFSFFFVR